MKRLAYHLNRDQYIIIYGTNAELFTAQRIYSSYRWYNKYENAFLQLSIGLM